MTESRESVILDVKLDAGAVAEDLAAMIARIKALKDQQKDLTAQIKAGNDVNGEYAAQLLRVKDQLAWTEKQAKGLSATTKLLNADTLTYTDSLNGERQKLADMHKAYDQLNAAQRNSEGGQAFLASIQAQSDKVKELDEATGRAQRNVGNYPKVVTAIVPGFEKATVALNKMGVSIEDVAQNGGKSFASIGQSAKAFGKAILTPPVGVVVAILSAILLVIQKVREAFKKNDDATTNMQKAFAALQPVLNVVNKVFDAMAVVVSKLVLGISKLFTGIIDIIPGFTDAAEAAAQLVEAQDRLEDTEREYTVNSARRNAEISKLRDEAADKEKHTTEERLALLQQAADKEKENLEDEKAIAAENLRILEEEAKQNADTSDEMKNKIAEARAAMYKAEETYYNGTRALQKQMQAAQKEIADEEAAAAKALEDEKKKQAEEAKKRAEERKRQREKEAKEAADLAKAQADNEAEIRRLAEDFALSQIEDETARAIATRKLQGERELDDLRARLADRSKLTADAFAELSKLIAEKETALANELDQMANDAADKRTADELDADRQRAARVLELRKELAKTPEEQLDAERQLLDLKLAQELEAVNLSEEEKLLIRQTFAKKAQELDDEYAANLVATMENARKAYAASLKGTAAQASDTFKSMQSLLQEYGEQNEKAAVASRAFGFASIITDQAVSIANTAKAITEAVSGATQAAAAGGPAAPFLLAGYIAGMVGAVLSAVASVAGSFQSAKGLMSQASAGNFNTGGVVGGYTSAPSRVDDTYAHVGSGEMILNASQQARLFDIANGGTPGVAFDYSQLAAVVVAAVETIPAPVMDYQEFTTFEGKVATYNEITKI